MSGDPWARASLKSSEDARAVHDAQREPHRIGFYLIQDPTLLKAVAWSETGAVLYPGPRAFVPTRFELSLDELDHLTRLSSEASRETWSNFDRDGTELLYCQTSPRICLIYDRNELQSELGVSLNATNRGMMVLLAVLGVLSLGLALRHGASAKTSDDLVLVPEHHSARRGTLEVALTPRDVRLLEFLQTRQGKVVTKDELYDAGWGRDFMPNSRALDQHMINLRKKLDPDKSRSPVIETVRGVGYKLLK
ncbi:MAG: winged helix-turn-helix domain-containing protein [Pseudomonadota bacterium]